jgi:hypothetical protein
MIDKSFLLDEVLNVIDSQGLEMQDVCNMLEIDFNCLVDRFADKVLDHKEAFGIFDDIMEDLIEEELDIDGIDS